MIGASSSYLLTALLSEPRGNILSVDPEVEGMWEVVAKDAGVCDVGDFSVCTRKCILRDREERKEEGKKSNQRKGNERKA
jgi:hypothetical protein